MIIEDTNIALPLLDAAILLVIKDSAINDKVFDAAI